MSHAEKPETKTSKVHRLGHAVVSMALVFSRTPAIVYAGRAFAQDYHDRPLNAPVPPIEQVTSDEPELTQEEWLAWAGEQSEWPAIPLQPINRSPERN